jgi:hypothetical protein
MLNTEIRSSFISFSLVDAIKVLVLNWITKCKILIILKIECDWQHKSEMYPLDRKKGLLCESKEDFGLNFYLICALCFKTSAWCSLTSLPRVEFRAQQNTRTLHAFSHLNEIAQKSSRRIFSGAITSNWIRRGHNTGRAALNKGISPRWRTTPLWRRPPPLLLLLLDQLLTANC